MNHIYLIYRSITQAQRAGAALRRAGITYGIFRTPAGLTQRGCSYSVRIYERDHEVSRRMLTEEGLPCVAAFRRDEMGFTQVTG